VTIRIAVRSFSGDCLRHLYRVDQLDDPVWEFTVRGELVA
jgi:hypothetical protein